MIPFQQTTNEKRRRINKITSLLLDTLTNDFVIIIRVCIGACNAVKGFYYHMLKHVLSSLKLITSKEGKKYGTDIS